MLFLSMSQMLPIALKKAKILIMPHKAAQFLQVLLKRHLLHALTHLNLNPYPQDTDMSYLLTCYTVFLST